ncbi:esterase family protein [Mucilaginibacter robiniae]|uniref:Esterase family protein n=1 Tax=Mucilaginibacter robiniae TaxID=2728022 RepID=A0A7L5E0D6_9SPHI|nr:alpha/beta hydrolase-fold protein [Mucilaginibacter robiniae]QJD96840.1 esterase family protein [Mucilaginibacter robiniae]
MHREYHNWYSHRLQRHMELLIFGHSGKAVLFFPPRMGRFYDYENWGIIHALYDRINNGELQVFCVDSIDTESFYNAGVHPATRIHRHLQYEQYILHEVLPLIYAKNSSGYLEVAGCSMGAYHAINLAFKYPWLFKKAVGMSGRYDLTHAFWHFKDIFDGYHSPDIYFNMPLEYVPNLRDEYFLNTMRHMEIIMAIGSQDTFLNHNQKLSEELWHKAVPNQLYIWEGEAHKPRYWRQMVRLYL